MLDVQQIENVLCEVGSHDFLRYAFDYLLSEKCHGDVHGWDLHSDCTFQFYKGTGSAENATTERLITFLHKLGILEPLGYCPNLSQKAFKSLECTARAEVKKAKLIENFPFPGFVTHFVFQVNRAAIKAVLATKTMQATKSTFTFTHLDKTFADLDVGDLFLFEHARIVAEKLSDNSYREVATGQAFHHADPSMIRGRALSKEETTVTREDIAAHFGVDRVQIRKDGVRVPELVGPKLRWRWVGYQNEVLSGIILKRVQKGA